MKIQVTQEDIDKGNPKDCKDCPVWRALSRALKRKDLSVGIWSCFIRKAPPITFPENVAILIENMIDGKEVEPFEFNIEIPS